MCRRIHSGTHHRRRSALATFVEVFQLTSSPQPGSFGTVRIGVHRLTNTRVAVKQVSKSLPFVRLPCFLCSSS